MIHVPVEAEKSTKSAVGEINQKTQNNLRRKMEKIKITKNPEQKKLDELGIFNWPIWEKEASTFPWTYSEEETCYFLKGEVVVVTETGEEVEMGQGDLVTFPSGMSCTWKIKKDVRKHYQFG